MLILTAIAFSSVLLIQPQPPTLSATKDSVRLDIESLPKKRSPRGTPEHVEGLQKTEDLLVKTLTDLGYHPTLQDVKWALPGQPKEGAPEPKIWHNIIVETGGEDPDLKHEVLIMGAHFDAVPAAPGADDNGSGVAALLHIARVIKPLHLKRTVRLVFFNLEEVGLVGAQVYARSVTEEFKPTEREGLQVPARSKLIGMASLESIGYFSDAPSSQKSPIEPIKGVFEPPTVGDFLAVTGIAMHQQFSRRLAKAMTTANPDSKTFLADFFPMAIPDIMRSDHMPFLMAGLPAVMITDTANFRNPNYHKETDTIETLDLDRLAKAANALAGATAAIAEEMPAAKK
jgi:aminopeptidase YwaD